MTIDVAIVTCLDLPEPDVDEAPLLEALRARGLSTCAVGWDDPAVDWAQMRLAVLRSPWNYHHHVARFLAWCDATARSTTLRNPPDVVRWNAHKRYLVELGEAGLPIVPTTIVRPGDDLGLSVSGDVVIKPAVSAGSYATERFALARERAAAERHLAALLEAGREAMLQPYQREVEGRGERAVVWIDGAFTHAVRKSPRFGSDDESVALASIEQDELALATRVLDHIGHDDLLYARVDVVRDDRGRPRLMELELIEPSLFLIQHPPALERFADVLARHV